MQNASAGPRWMTRPQCVYAVICIPHLLNNVQERARQMPGREQEVWDFYRKNPDALASLRAPIFEDKVVDFILELAKVTDKTVSREDLYKDDDA